MSKGQTISEKILSRQSIDDRSVYAGDRVDVKPNTVLTNEMLPMVSISKFYQTGAKKVNQELAKNMLIILDHGGFGTTDKMVNFHELTRNFASNNGIALDDAGSGISHVVFHEKGFAQPGYLILGTDSHTVTHGAFNSFSKGIGGSDLVELMVKGTTWLDVPETNLVRVDGILPQHVYSKDVLLHVNGEKKMTWSTDKAIEWQGSTIHHLSMEARLTMSNMAIEQGGVAGIMPYDDKTKEYLPPTNRDAFPVEADEDAEYTEIFEVDATTLEPVVAAPHSPDNVKPVSELGDIELDQVFIGSCTNARIEDFDIMAKLIKGRKFKTRTIVIPGSAKVGLEAAKKGYVELFMEAGATWAYSTCGACYGGSLGRAGPGMKVLSTTNRNFIGRMGGDKTTEVYLGSPATAVSSAIMGKIVSAKDLV
ncbi:MAG: aconitase/3-isopropylmalate dehydratase large subunit family protein [Candidatus Heimdallarchaeota archaeon]|nr:aconitase/3-isopropylmalate dehydratase large subunit family protein [Candidatus Heimdallarchaeota archaeon]